MELSKQEMELFLPLAGQKTSFTTLSPFQPRNTKLVFQTGNGIIKTGYGIISPTSRPLTKKILLQHILHIYQGIQI